ncbi:hypothetical protein ABTZ78_17120 [Streptomyces bauhiniae]|uniref:hypothetical protein n=1 Tax=Streptomyces bauhiniae TaxID=2340725 RepID=UPI00332C786E
MTQPDRLTDEQLDEYEAVLQNAVHTGSDIALAAGAVLLAEVRRHRAELAAPATELRDHIADALARADGWQWADGLKGRSPIWREYQRRADAVLPVLPAPVGRAAILREVADRYDAILKRATGRPGFDPRYYQGVHDVIHGLRRLADEASTPTEAVEGCGRCRHAFDPADERFDGHARFKQTPYCRRCVDTCRDTEMADHRCVICA